MLMVFQRIRAFFLISFLASVFLGSAYPTWAMPSDELRLVVVISSTEPLSRVDEIVNDLSDHLMPAPPFDAGSPTAARPLIIHRSSGDFRDWLAANPSDSRAIAERTVLLTYGDPNDLENARTALQSSAEVEEVRDPGDGELSSPPNDPLYADSGNPATHQWGLHAMNLEEAWSYGSGHAYIGYLDNGLEATSAGLCAGGPSNFEGGHEDLRAFERVGSTYVFRGGSFRSVYAADFGNPESTSTSPDYCVDERQPVLTIDGTGPETPPLAGHGTHVAGILSATTNNSLGVAGLGIHSSLMAANWTRYEACSEGACFVEFGNAPFQAESVHWLVDQGAQIINFSGNSGPDPDDPEPDADVLAAVLHADARDVLFVAASGNRGNGGGTGTIEADWVRFPASHSSVLGVGALQPNGERALWSMWYHPTIPDALDFTAPGTSILSTFYRGLDWVPASPWNCTDSSHGASDDGYGLCTGTSMSTPMIAGVASLVRSANPLLSKTAVRDALIAASTNTCTINSPRCAAGIPDAGAAVKSIVGNAAGQVLPNRLSPMFSLYSSTNTDHLFTNVPQMASAAVCDFLGGAGYVTNFGSGQGATLPHYPSFPGCSFGTAAARTPRASFYVFTTDKNPIVTAPALIPIYRMSRPTGTLSQVQQRFRRNRIYVTQVGEIENLRNQNPPWEIDGVEGFIFPPCGGVASPCSTSCAPPGTELLKRWHKPSATDYVLAPASQESIWTSAPWWFDPASAVCLGHIYVNTDNDGDHVIDGFEELAGTHPEEDDSDCDGQDDGEELLSYSLTTHSYGDPLSAPGCYPFRILVDDFEGPEFGPWEKSANLANVAFDDDFALFGTQSLDVEISGVVWGMERYGFIALPIHPEPRYRARFYFSPEELSMLAGSAHVIFAAQTGTGSNVLRIQLTYSSGAFLVRLGAYQDTGGPIVHGAWRIIDNDEATAIEIDWRGSTSGSSFDGFAKLWLNGQLVDSIGGLDVYDRRVENTKIGVVSGWDVGTLGHHLFDSFEARNATYIGLLP